MTEDIKIFVAVQCPAGGSARGVFYKGVQGQDFHIYQDANPCSAHLYGEAGSEYLKSRMSIPVNLFRPGI
jgi:hypothetical protein